MGQVVPLLVVIGVVAVASLWYRRVNGAVRRIDATFGPEELRELGLPERRQSLLLFTAPGCPPCTVAKRALDEVSLRLGVPVVVADVIEHHAIAAQQHVYRAPTVFVVDERGHAISRISGVPRDGQVEEALGELREVAA